MSNYVSNLLRSFQKPSPHILGTISSSTQLSLSPIWHRSNAMISELFSPCCSLLDFCLPSPNFSFQQFPPASLHCPTRSQQGPVFIAVIQGQFRGTAILKYGQFRGNIAVKMMIFAVEMTDFAVKMTDFAIISRQNYAFMYFTGLFLCY